MPRWDGEFRASHGVDLEIQDVSTISNCFANKCGDFGNNSRVNIPFLDDKIAVFEFSASLWFKKITNTVGAPEIILSTNGCQASSMYIMSVSETLLEVKLTVWKEEYNITTVTPPQVNNFVHVVLTFWASRSTWIGRMRVYINGNLIEELPTLGKIKLLPGPMVLGSDNCGEDTEFIGQMDSVSFSRTELSKYDVLNLYWHRACIGDRLVY